jgi:hypothetical protein
LSLKVHLSNVPQDLLEDEDWLLGARAALGVDEKSRRDDASTTTPEGFARGHAAAAVEQLRAEQGRLVDDVQYMKVVLGDHPSKAEVADAIKPLSDDVHRLRSEALGRPEAERLVADKVDRRDIRKLAKVLAGTADASELEAGAGLVDDPFVAAKLQHPPFKCLSCDKPVALIPSWARVAGDVHARSGDALFKRRSEPVDSNNRPPPRPKSAKEPPPAKAEEVVEADPSSRVSSRGGTFVPQARPKSAAGHYVKRKHASLMKGGRMNAELDDFKYTGEYKKTYEANPFNTHKSLAPRPSAARRTKRSKSPPQRGRPAETSKSATSLRGTHRTTKFADVVQEASGRTSGRNLRSA